MKKSVSILIALILLLSILPIAQVAQADAPGTYNPGDIAIVNALIDRYPPGECPYLKAPADGSADPAWGGVAWSNSATDKRLEYLRIPRGLPSMGTKPFEGPLDVSALDKLKTLDCTQHAITALDVSGCAELEALRCGSNVLTSLDLSNNPALFSLECYSNRLTALDVSNKPALSILHCGGNPLNSLDVSGNPALVQLLCYSNRLTSLDVSNNPVLSTLQCQYNRLPYVYDGDVPVGVDVPGIGSVNKVTWNPQEQAAADIVVMRIDQLFAMVGDQKVRVNDAQDLTPIFNIGGRTMVPFRFIATCFGAGVDWDGDLGSVIIKCNGKTIQIPIDMPYAYVNGVQTPINAPAEIMTEYNRTFVPFRAVAELLEINVDYDSDTMTIIASEGEIDVAKSVADYDALMK